MGYKARLDLEELDLDTLAWLEHPTQTEHTMAAIRHFVSRLLVDEDSGNPIPEDEAERIAGRMTLRQARAIVEQAAAAYRALQEQAVPPATGSA